MRKQISFGCRETVQPLDLNTPEFKMPNNSPQEEFHGQTEEKMQKIWNKARKVKMYFGGMGMEIFISLLIKASWKSEFRLVFPIWLWTGALDTEILYPVTVLMSWAILASINVNRLELVLGNSIKPIFMPTFMCRRTGLLFNGRTTFVVIRWPDTSLEILFGNRLFHFRRISLRVDTLTLRNRKSHLTYFVMLWLL